MFCRTTMIFFQRKHQLDFLLCEALSIKLISSLELHFLTMLHTAPTLKRLRKFKGKYKLNFPLLADPEHQVAEKFGAWREKNMYGKKSMGIQRSTFLIDSEGRVAKVWKKVNVDGHDEEVIEAIKSL